jgi:hypothetical protein
MDIEHCERLSLSWRRRECHEQDGGTLASAAITPRIDPASGDPAMAFDLPVNGRAAKPVSEIGSGFTAG